MAILVLARAYVRSRFTPTVFRSWRLAAGRLPCYFILCLLLLEGTPQTKKVAMGCLLDGPATAEGQTRKLMLNAIASNALPPNGIQSGPQPHSPSGGGIVNVDSAWPVVPSGGTRTTTLPDITTFKKDLVVMAAGKDKQWMTDPLVTRKTKGTRKVNGNKKLLHNKRVKRNAQQTKKDFLKSLQPTKGFLHPYAHKTFLSYCFKDGKDVYIYRLRKKLQKINRSFGLVVEVDERSDRASFFLLRRLKDFVPSKRGTDSFYFVNRGKPENHDQDNDDIGTVRFAANSVAETLPAPDGIVTVVAHTVKSAHATDLHSCAKNIIIAVIGSVFSSALFFFMFGRFLVMSAYRKSAMAYKASQP
eukprot:GHVS01024255.1.p1 GENE.GHVS01024255.1~~GHVS01024255.1.p1  ORF type:complete len:402 (+),score=40.06 GHVS01024255.1:130-1206(+)